MKLAVTADDRTYSIQVPWWLLVAGLLGAMLWHPAAAWASHTFSDVPSSHTFHDDIVWMAETGVTRGCGEDAFCPDDYVTRGQMAAFMRRFATNVTSGASDGGSGDAEVEARVADLESAVSTLQSRVAALASEDDALQGEVDALQSLLAGVSRSGDVLRFTGMNLQVRDGSGDTHGVTNGLGNLIVGYDESNGDTRTGSHNLVVGPQHTYSSYGGVVAGRDNAVTARYSSVTGGYLNEAAGRYSSISGGQDGLVDGLGSSISGGYDNTVAASYASVSGGRQGTASGYGSTVSGGQENSASGAYSSVSGGKQGSATNIYTSVSGGFSNEASAPHASISGGNNGSASGNYSSLSGGYQRAATNADDWAGGDLYSNG